MGPTAFLEVDVPRTILTLRVRRYLVALVTASVVATLGLFVATDVASAAGDPCAGGNPVACENSKPGTDPGEWQIDGAGDDAIQGFATAMSVNPGDTIKFKVKASASYTVDVYRLGYYQGLGARRQAPTWTVNNPVKQGACAADPKTQNYDCGTWAVSTQWAVPSTAVSGVYVAKLTAGSDESQITFVVRDDSSHSDVVFKTSDATWQAYNTYGDADFYTAPNSITGSQARAFKISYNRPFATKGANEGRDFLFSNEYPTLRFLERNGVDVSYTTDIDVSTGTTVLTQHKAFMSVGHDEYWTLPERNNVEAARDAGVNLMFLSGNEVYWHTRLEPSIDGSGTANRTLVCYKDSWDSSKIDPTAEGTPTWRDPAYAAPNGSRPENSLTGTLYMSNNTDLAITVSAAQGKSRLWRGTSLAALPVGGSATLAPHSIGYESDEDLDNGSRPAGLMRLSETTGPTDQAVQDPAGTKVAAGTTTHSLTLYRAPSGALVFGAGTINWGWGLDQTHDGDNSNPADPRMQQATLNMLADMNVLPTTLMAGLIMPSASTDTRAPSVAVTSPQAGAALANGAQVTVSGTATDNGGGVVTTVEVSLDGGQSYHRATGTTSWTYSGVLSGAGASSIKVRANDDSANLSTPTSVNVTVSCPCSLFGAQVPTTPTTSDSSAVELGVKFTADADGFVQGVRFFKGSGNTGTHTGTLWTSSGSPLAAGTFSGESASGWQTLTFANAVPVTAGATYVVSYFAPNGHYAADAQFFTAADYRAAPLSAPGRPAGVANGVYADGHGFPTQSYGDTNYWVDVLYSRDDTTPPTVANTSPVVNATSVATTVKPSATFAGTVDPSSVVMTLKDAQGNNVLGTTTFDAASRTARFAPMSPLAHSATYTAAVTAQSGAGVAMAAPYSWTFTVSATDPLPGVCPCSIWPDTATPATASSPDTGSVELGMKFTADVDGAVTGVRFYKGTLNLGTHTGSLWTANGGLLANVTFVGESASGWQTAYFTSPVDIAAGTTYIVSYRAPIGGYALTTNGLAGVIDSPPLHTVAGGAVYTYGAGAPLTASDANYWVDLVFMASDAAPTLTSTSPGATATNVPVLASVSGTFAAQIQAGTARLAVKDPNGAAVAGAITWNAATRTVAFTPAASFAPGATYSATVSGATALSGNLMSPYSWQFTTAGVTACPCTLFDSTAVPVVPDSGDSGAVELGVSFSAAVDGMVTGVRFYKSTLNTGTHIGNLWTADGTLLASGTFTGESASGWQTLTFPGPVSVTAGTTYVASYFTPDGHYAATSHFFDTAYANGPLSAGTGNGLYRYGSASGFPTASYGGSNYWVDPIFKTGVAPDTTPPTVLGANPLDGSTSQAVASTPAVTFSEPVDPSAIILTLKGSDGSTVAGTTAYDNSTRTATFTPSTTLARGVTYTGSAKATDLSGNESKATFTWSFRTAMPDAAPGVCPCSIWTDASTPATLTDPDSVPIELGTQFTSDVSGRITGVRFYKGPQNIGTHTVSLWSTDGTRLATATATGESTTGWQTVSFASPVNVAAGTAYVVSYLAPQARYSSTAYGLSAVVDAAPLHTVPNGGRFLYGGGFPANVSSANYWVDPVLDTSPAPEDTTAPAISGVSVATSGSTATITWTTDEPASTVVTYGTTSALGSTATGSDGTTSHSVTITGLSSATSYYYRVSSTDAAGNTATSPASPAAPGTFTAADTTAPVVSAVAVSGTGTTRTVTWVTDKPATSVLAYGTTTSLGTTATGATGTTHSVSVSGLTNGATYYYRVTSVDAAGNSTTSPATSGAPGTFTVADTAPPVVTALAATGSGTTASVTWTTDESATSVVSYGTSATSLGSSVTGASGTSHTVTLTGLAPNTRYYYRVTSADPSGNATTSPATSSAAASYVPTVAPITRTTIADFATGTGGYVSDTGGGEVIATPAAGYEFAGTTIPSGLTATALVTGGTTTVANKVATVSGSRLTTTTTAPSTSSFAAMATLGAGHSIGYGTTQTGSTATRAAFVMTATGGLTAVINDGFINNRTVAIPGTWTGAMHEYRVDVTPTSATFFVDGAQVATNQFFGFVALRPMLIDPVNDANPLSIDWVRVGPYASSSTYVSGVMDAGATVGWDTLTRDVAAPTGTTVTIQVRSGSTATPGIGWTGWTTVSASTGSITRSARYLQYQVISTTSGSRFVTSSTRSVQLTFHVL